MQNPAMTDITKKKTDGEMREVQKNVRALHYTAIGRHKSLANG